MVAMLVFPYLRYSLHLLYVEKVDVAAQRKLTYQFHVSFEIHVLRTQRLLSRPDGIRQTARTNFRCVHTPG